MGHRQTVQTQIRYLITSVSDQGLHCLIAEWTIKIWAKMKITTHHPLKSKWAHPTGKSRQVHLVEMG